LPKYYFCFWKERDHATLGEQKGIEMNTEDALDVSKPLQMTLKGSTGMRVNRALEILAMKTQKRQMRQAQVSRPLSF
jgi:hypothetical protein